MSSARFTLRNIEWGPLIIFAVGGLLFLLGAGRFVVAHRFSLSDALYCCLAVIPVCLLLLVIAYVVQHAILASIVPLAAAGVLAFSSPVFDVALGLALMGAIAGPALSEWKNEKRTLRSAIGHEGEDKDRR